MSTYAIGDIQGCFATLEKLLDHIHFNPKIDSLWFTGDLVNRGPQSLETLRFVKALGSHHHTVLGNHDLHLLAVAHGAHPGAKDDTLDAILSAPDRIELLDWLCNQPLLHHDQTLNYAMVHAGFSPTWDLTTAKNLAHEVETILRSEKAIDFYNHMYGNHPDKWQDDLTGWDRWRCITNFFTRVRFCYTDGRLELKNKGAATSQPHNLIPWFQIENRATKNQPIVFGHWAALGGVTETPNTFALDTAAVR